MEYLGRITEVRRDTVLRRKCGFCLSVEMYRK
jgi:hypothetical protein